MADTALAHKNKKKPDTKASLKRKLRVILHKYIRLRDAYFEDGEWWVNCVTCGERIPYKASTAGHFFPAGTYPAVRFAEWNINGQCIRCNKYQHGALILYTIEMIKRYSIKGLDHFYGIATGGYQDFTMAELRDLIDEYKEKLNSLVKSKAFSGEDGRKCEPKV
ncbi:putative Lambda NinG family protein [uncultured Spirochaetota bacterium]|nr:putative Lambda NinG family protein [uncultured Spirochaetota bacterium]